MNYSAHATAVAGFIGSKNQPFTFNLSNGTTHPVNFKGVAPNSKINSYSFQTTTLPGETTTSNVFQKLLISQPKLSNHSYGATSGWVAQLKEGKYVWVWNAGPYGTPQYYDLNGTYFSNDFNYDLIVNDNPNLIIVKSAGNSFGDGPGSNPQITEAYYMNNGNLVKFEDNDPTPPVNCAQGYDCIGPGSLAKNIIVVGATDRIIDNDGRYSLSNVKHSDYSSAGPRDDGGIKPDITTVGTDVAHASTPEDTIGNNSIGIGSGTSYSAPVVTGIIGLWTQISKQLSNTELHAASAKTLTIHSAAEAGNIGPDVWYGWGFIDAKKGAELLLGKANNTVIMEDETLTHTVKNIKKIKASGTEPLKVTISWIDPQFDLPPMNVANIHNNRVSKLVNDLDLRIIDETTNTIHYPWRLNINDPLAPALRNGDNTVDNVEQVVIDNPTAGATYRIEITNKKQLKDINGQDTDKQAYSLIATGLQETNLSTTEATSGNEIKVYPTLTRSIVNIQSTKEKLSQIRVYDLSGKQVLQKSTAQTNESIDVSTLSKGIYLLHVQVGSQNVTKKIIKE